MFIDTKEYLADQLFINEKIRIKFKGDYVKNGEKYIGVMASCSSKDWCKVQNVLDSLSKKMIIWGYTDYPEYCENLIKQFKDEYSI